MYSTPWRSKHFSAQHSLQPYVQGSYYFAIQWEGEPDDWDTYGETWNGITFALNGGADTGEYDFDNDGDMESCSVHFIFVRD